MVKGVLWSPWWWGGVVVSGVLVFFNPLWGWAFLVFWGIGFGSYHQSVIAHLDDWIQTHSPVDRSFSGNAWEQRLSRLTRWEQELKNQQKQTHEALERSQRAGEALPVGLVILDAQDRMVWSNPSAQMHLGISWPDDRQQSIHYLIRQEELSLYLKRPEARPLILREARQHLLIIALQVLPYSPTERLLMTQDITQQQREEQIRQDFVSNVSHELRTPLTVVEGYIETLIDDPTTRGDPMILKMLETALAQTKRMELLVNELLTLSKLESMTQKAPLTVVYLAAVQSQLQEMMEQLSRGAHRIYWTGFDGVILGVETEILSAFGNLVANAVRYTPANGTIKVSWAFELARGVFCVEDTGSGIATQHLGRLGERFYRVDEGRSRRQGGTGLGLAIVKQIAWHHEAQLLIESTVGVGSQFRLLFPEHRCQFLIQSSQQ